MGGQPRHRRPAAAAFGMRIKWTGKASSDLVRLHEHLRPGSRLSLTGPAGQFCFPAGPVAAPARGQLYLSAGSGVTPLMSMCVSVSVVTSGAR